MGDGMSTPQRVVLAVALLLIALSGLYCPWTLTVSRFGTSGPNIYINERAFLIPVRPTRPVQVLPYSKREPSLNTPTAQPSQTQSEAELAFLLALKRSMAGTTDLLPEHVGGLWPVNVRRAEGGLWVPVHLPGWHLIGARINHRELLVEWAVIAAAAGGIVLLLPRRKRRRTTA